MPIDFPSTGLTANVTTYTSEGKTWIWTGYSWKAVLISPAQGIQGISGVQGSTGFVSQSSPPTDTSLLWLDTDEPADTTTLSFNAQTGTSYTITANDIGNFVTLSNNSSITVTVPPNVFTSGQIINLQQINVGQVTFAQGAGVTITSAGATSTAPKTRARYSAATVICTGSNTFTIVGDIT
jgi:hypothetical protein